MSSNFMMEESLFAKALQVAPDQRDIFLRETCGEHVELRSRIERLLLLHQQQNTILDTEWEEPGEDGGNIV